MSLEQTLDALLSLPKLSSPAVSPDGQWVAWSWFGIRSTAGIYYAPSDGAAPPLALTETDDDALLVSWTPDSTGVIVAQDHQGDERVRLFRVDLESPHILLPLTAASPPYFLHGGQLQPDGRTLVYAINYDVESGMEIEPTWVYRHDLVTGERIPLACPHKPGHIVPRLNTAGTHVLYERQDLNPAGSQVWLVDIDGTQDREILNFGAAAKVKASLFPDSRRVLFLTDGDGYRKLGLWELDTGITRWLVDNPSRNIECAFAPRGSTEPMVVIVEIREARVRASLLNADTGQERLFPDVAGNLLPLRPVAGGDWIGEYYRSTHPDDLVRFRPDSGDMEPSSSITRIWDRTHLQPHDLSAAEDFRWTSPDGTPIQGWLYHAAGATLGTIIHVHGGPTSHSEDDFAASIQYFVAAGFNVLSANYRGSTGFGLPFEESIKIDGWGGREQDDIRSGIEALIEEDIAQRGKVGITGTSYGGYSSWCAVTRWPLDILAAAAPICGMTDLVVDYETTRPDLRPYSEEMMGGTPDTTPQRYHDRSPIHFVNQIRARLLIVQGLRDPNVSPQNVRAVREALDLAGVAYEVLAFEDEGHGISRKQNQKVLYTRLVEFFTEAFSPVHAVV